MASRKNIPYMDDASDNIQQEQSLLEKDSSGYGAIESTALNLDVEETSEENQEEKEKDKIIEEINANEESDLNIFKQLLDHLVNIVEIIKLNQGYNEDVYDNLFISENFSKVMTQFEKNHKKIIKQKIKMSPGYFLLDIIRKSVEHLKKNKELIDDISFKETLGKGKWPSRDSSKDIFMSSLIEIENELKGNIIEDYKPKLYHSGFLVCHFLKLIRNGNIIELKQNNQNVANIQNFLLNALSCGIVIADLENMNLLYQITKWNFLFISFSMSLYGFDVVSDFILGNYYFFEQEWVFAVLTLFFVIMPSLIINVFLDDGTAIWISKRQTKWFWLWIGPYIIFNIEPIVLYCKNLKRVKKFLNYNSQSMVQDQVKCWNKFILDFSDVTERRNWEAILEAGPQLLLQLFKVIKDLETFNLDLRKGLQLFSLLTSVIGWAATQFTTHKMNNLEVGKRVSVWGCMLFTIGQTIPIGCRVVAIAACMTSQPVWCLLILLLHFIGTTIWSWYSQDKNENTVLDAFIRGLGITLITLDINHFVAAISSNVIWFLEDLILMILWYTAEIKSPLSMTLLYCIITLDFVFRISCCLYGKFCYKFINLIR